MCGIVRGLVVRVLIVVPHGLFWEISGNRRFVFGEGGYPVTEKLIP